VRGPLRLELRLELRELGPELFGVVVAAELVNLAALRSSSSSPITLSTAAFRRLPNQPEAEEADEEVWRLCAIVGLPVSSAFTLACNSPM